MTALPRVVVLLLLLCGPIVGLAQDAPAPEAGDDDPVKLFYNGLELLRTGQPQAACKLLERSHQLSPTLGTLLNLGRCHEQSDRLATAHDYFRQAEVLATQAGDVDRRELAHNEAAELSSRRASLTLRIPVRAEAPFEVRLDDVLQPREAWERPTYIDAGEHRVVVQAAGHDSWEGTVMVVDGGKYLVAIPELRPQPRAALTPAEVAAPTRTKPAQLEPSPRHVKSGLGTGRVVALAVGGAGLAALGVSVGYAVAARSSFDESKPSCRATDVCNATGLRLREQAMAHATRATVLSISGGAALLGSLALWFLGAPHAESSSIAIAASPGVITAEWRGVL